MAGTFQLAYVPGYTLSDSSRGFSNSAVVLTKTTARFPSSSCLDHKLTGRLKCAAPNSRRPFVCRSSSDGYRERFEKWLHTHGISYSGKEEWLRRFQIYKTNLQHIDHHNSLNLSYKLTDNEFADLTEAEFSARYCGAKTPSLRSNRLVCDAAAEMHDEPEDELQAEPEINLAL
ncbi:hypothetical protein Rs2_35952 [Raphanus sativus]|nr:hypothetical protein Rs2_35952 [Raphanus sativus]